MKKRFGALKRWVARRFAAARERSARLDHLVRAKERYDLRRGDRQAGSVTFFGFLAFFPLVALAFAVLGYVIDFYPSAEGDITRGISSALPGLIGDEPGQISLDSVAEAKAGAGVIGLVGLVWVGTSWIDALRESLRSMWLQQAATGSNVLARKLYDLIVLVLLGGALLTSVALSGVATSATRLVLHSVDLADTGLVPWGLRVAAVTIAVCSSAVLFAVMFWRLSGVRIPRRRLIAGALLGGIGFELLKLFATYLVGRTTDKPVYATIAVAVGLLVWINTVSRLALFAAAWTATEAGSNRLVGEPRKVEESLDPTDAALVLDSEAIPLEPAEPTTTTKVLTRLGMRSTDEPDDPDERGDDQASDVAPAGVNGVDLRKRPEDGEPDLDAVNGADRYSARR